MDKEKEIVKGLISGNKSSFRFIYDKYSKELYYYALGIVKDKLLSEDIVQETFVHLWNNHQNISLNYPINAYLYKIVKNACLNQYRHQKVVKKYEDSFDKNEAFSEEEKSELLELIDKLKGSIEKLPEKCRKIFVLSCVEGLKYGEVAEDLGISTNTVKTQVRLAYKRIREDLDVNDLEIFSIIILLKTSMF
ncbi:MAG: RNA polymerase sigma-70 factor [Marinifilaceae bacterium]|jgi:RNA polymerase sigma-70 factor (ECF subfamily)|nr:RNA polymerase sigma-70 factor [Marinifilaceae bacterium]